MLDMVEIWPAQNGPRHSSCLIIKSNVKEIYDKIYDDEQQVEDKKLFQQQNEFPWQGSTCTQ